MEFICGLADKEVALDIVSGSDHPDVVREANALGITKYFGLEIFGAFVFSKSNGILVADFSYSAELIKLLISRRHHVTVF